MSDSAIWQPHCIMKVQCQRTRMFIEPGSRKVGGVWVCPHCDRGETYQQAELVDPELCDLVHEAVGRARELFGVADDDRETRVWLGDDPETVLEADLKTYHVYLGRDSNWLQYCYSGAHEALHRACSPCDGTGHWVDELLAVHFSLRYLREIGLSDHAALNELNLETASSRCPRHVALSDEGRSYPDGYYGACFVLGRELIEATGWDGLVELNRARDEEGHPEPDRWINGLEDEIREEVERILAN